MRLVARGHRHNLEVADARRLEGGDALGDVTLGTAQRHRLEQIVRHQRFGLGLLAVEVEILNLLGFLFVAIPADDVVVEVAPLGAHSAYVQGHHGSGQVPQSDDVVPLADGYHPANRDLQGVKRRIPFGPTRLERIAPHRVGLLGNEEHRNPPVGDLGGHSYVLLPK